MESHLVKFAVITVSDRASQGLYKDSSGPLAIDRLSSTGKVVFSTVVPDEIEPIQGAVREAMHAGAEIIISSGGTGITSRDQTPQAISSIISYEIPGIPALIRAKSETIMAALSRSIAGVIDDGTYRSFILCLPGSPTAVDECLSITSDLFPHIVDQLADANHSSHSQRTFELAHTNHASTGHGEVIIAEVTESSVAISALEEAVTCDEAGAITSFCGRVRNHDLNKSVAAIDYSAHPSAPEIISTIAQQIASQYGLHKVAVVHRIGHLNIGDIALAVAVSSDHRKESFQAVEAIVERIKLELPVWKNQQFSDGTSQWSGMA